MTTTSGQNRKPVLSTMWGAEDDPNWVRLVDVVRTDRPGSFSDLQALWRESRDREVVVLRGSVTLGERYRDLVFASLLRFRRRPPRVLITDATWETGSRSLEAKLPGFLHPLLPLMAKGVVRAVDGRHVRYAVLSTDEVSTFPRTWGVDPSRVVFTPFLHTLYGDVQSTVTIHDGGYLFAGGDSMRDYGMLETAVAGQDFDVEMATRWQPSTPLPNVHARRTSHEEFVSLMAGARAVVVPMVTAERSSGQQTYLNAMVLGKPVVVTRSPGVADYIQDGVTGVVVDPDPTALRTALAEVMDPANREKYEAMGQRAREHVLANFHDLEYKRSLLAAAGLDPSTLVRAS